MEEQDQLGATWYRRVIPIPHRRYGPAASHRQAANYPRQPAGAFVVTMEHPKVSAPEPLVITIDHRKATIRKRAIAASVAVTSVAAPRAGRARAVDDDRVRHHSR